MTSPDTNTNQPRICLGKITGPHGVKGLVKVLPFGDDPYLLEDLAPLYTAETGDKTLSLTLKSASGKFFLASVTGCDTREAAEAIQGTTLWVARDDLPEIEDEGEYYISDLIGLDVYNMADEKIGHVLQVPNFGAGDLLEIQPVSTTETFFLPFKDEFVPTVDIKARKIVVRGEQAFMAD